MEIPKLVVRAIIEGEKGKILLLRRADEVCKGMYNLPGGKVEGRSLKQALISELEEETGLIFEPSDLSYLCYKYETESRTGYPWIMHYFYTRITQDEKIILNEESSEYGFFNKDEISELELAFKPDKEVIKGFYS